MKTLGQFLLKVTAPVWLPLCVIVFCLCMAYADIDLVEANIAN